MKPVKTRDLLSIRDTEESKGKRRVAFGEITNVVSQDDPRVLSKTGPSMQKKPDVDSKEQRTKHMLEVCTASRVIGKTKQSNWTPEEDKTLRDAVAEHKAKNWKLIGWCVHAAEALPKRTESQCLHRWQKVLNPILVKGYWTKEEDERMYELVGMFGTKRWAAIARSLPGRNGKQCRERWCNHLDPQLSCEPWTETEDMMLFLAHAKFGNKWAEISKVIPGRSDNGIKNRWNTCVKKQAKAMERCVKFLDLDNPAQNTGTHNDSQTAGREGEDQQNLQKENSAPCQELTSQPPPVMHNVPVLLHRDRATAPSAFRAYTRTYTVDRSATYTVSLPPSEAAAARSRDASYLKL